MADDQTAYSYQAPDRRIYDMLFGTGEGGFGLFPQVQQYYQDQLKKIGEKDSNPFTYSGERIADFSPREQYAMRLADAGIGAYAPYLSRAKGLTEEALATTAGGVSEAKAAQLRAQQQGEDYTRTGISATQAAQRGLQGDLRGAQQAARRSVTAQQPFIDRAARDIRRSQRGFDPSSIDAFMDPYEDAVVQQTIKDIQKGQATGDIARRASDVAQGALGGSRSRISQQESDDAATRAMMKEVGAIRSAGFGSSRDAAMNEFARQRAADASAAGLQSGLGAQAGGAQSGLSSLLSGLGAQRYGAGMGTAGALTGAGQQLYGMGAGSSGALAGLTGQLSGAQTGAAGAMQGLAGQEVGFRQGDVSSMMNVGAMDRARNQALMDLNYQNFVGQYNMPQQLMSGYANFLTGAGPLAGGFGYSGATQQNPYSMTTTAYAEGGPTFPNKGLAALAKKAPEVVKKMGFQVPQKRQMGGLVNPRFPMASRKLGA